MTPEERETMSRSIANLWAFHAIFISHLLHSLRSGGLSEEQIELLLQGLDADSDLLDGVDDQAHMTELLATVRNRLAASR